MENGLRPVEGQAGEASAPVCHGDGWLVYPAEFLSGEPPVEGGQCRHCNGAGSRPMSMKHRAVLDKRRIRCACLGTALNLPMTTVTLVEDLGMAAMAAAALLWSH